MTSNVAAAMENAPLPLTVDRRTHSLSITYSLELELWVVSDGKLGNSGRVKTAKRNVFGVVDNESR